MKKFLSMVSLVAAIALSGSAQAKQFVINGDFSSLTNGLGQLNYNTVATGWSTTGYNFVMNVADVGSSGQYGNLSLYDFKNGGDLSWTGLSPSGSNFVAMDGDFSTNPVEQTITGLTAGKTYNLSFNYAFGQQAGFNGATNQHITASFGGSPVFQSSPDLALASHGFSGWNTYSGTVTATNTSEVLSFLAYGDTPVPPFSMLTSVSLTGAVPEPSTWATMILGLGGMGALARRRRREMAIA